MKISTLLLEKIKSDREFRMKLAIALGISERQVQNLVKANSENLTKYKAVEFFQSEGFTLEEIFANDEKAESV